VANTRTIQLELDGLDRGVAIVGRTRGPGGELSVLGSVLDGPPEGLARMVEVKPVVGCLAGGSRSNRLWSSMLEDLDQILVRILGETLSLGRVLRGRAWEGRVSMVHLSILVGAFFGM